MAKHNIIVLRLSHRIKRDKRVSTHVALTARALGATKIYYSGEKDESMENSVKGVVKRFGGEFDIEYIKNPFKLIKKLKYEVVNLTMYGLKVENVINKIKGNIIVIVGSEKVPIEYYKIADFNVSITNQPHSEISSLAIFLDRYFKGKELNKRFDGKIEIKPMERGKAFKGQKQ